MLKNFSHIPFRTNETYEDVECESSKITASNNNNNLDKLAQTPDDENPSPVVVPLENGSA